MNVDAAARVGGTSTLELTLLKVAALYLLLVKAVFAGIVPPNPDEAYYFVWGQHLQWSYFDHSPMVGWSTAIGHLLFGWSYVGMRVSTFVTFGIIAWAVSGWARRVAPESAERFFWVMIVVWMASPLLDILTTLNYPDHLLICFSVLALIRFSYFLADQRETGRTKLRDLYLGAVFLGLAALSKYNAIFVGLTLLAAIIAVPAYRPLFRLPHLYFAAALSMAIASPVLFWNIANGFPSLQYHAVGRFVNAGDGFTLTGTGRFLFQSFLFMGPFLVWYLVRPLWGPTLPGAAGSMQHLGRPIFFISTIAMVVLSVWGAAGRQVAPHWNILAFLPFVLLVPLYMRSRFMLWAHTILGVVALTITTAYFIGAPYVGALVGQGPGEAGRTWGYDQVAIAARAAKERTGAQLYAGPNYIDASKLAIALGSDKDMVSLGGGRRDQFHYWRDAAADAGKDVIVMSAGNTTADSFRDDFDSIELLEEVPTTRFGQPMATYRLYLGKGYKPR